MIGASPRVQVSRGVLNSRKMVMSTRQRRKCRVGELGIVHCSGIVAMLLVVLLLLLRNQHRRGCCPWRFFVVMSQTSFFIQGINQVTRSETLSSNNVCSFWSGRRAVGMPYSGKFVQVLDVARCFSRRSSKDKDPRTRDRNSGSRCVCQRRGANARFLVGAAIRMMDLLVFLEQRSLRESRTRALHSSPPMDSPKQQRPVH